LQESTNSEIYRSKDRSLSQTANFATNAPDTPNWYKSLPDNIEKDFDFKKFNEAFGKINPSIQAINS